MKTTLEIRWHGRGGQGAKTAALLLADVAFKTGAYVQGFPEYGPERMGAPITAFNRISDRQIRVHSNIYDPDLVVVVEVHLHVIDDRIDLWIQKRVDGEGRRACLVVHLAGTGPILVLAAGDILHVVC